MNTNLAFNDEIYDELIDAQIIFTRPEIYILFSTTI